MSGEGGNITKVVLIVSLVTIMALAFSAPIVFRANQSSSPETIVTSNETSETPNSDNVTAPSDNATAPEEVEVVEPEPEVNWRQDREIKPLTSWRSPNMKMAVLYSDETAKLSDHAGKKILLHIWGIHCGPCIHEMPHVEKVYQKSLEEGSNFAFLVVITTSSDKEETERRVAAVADKYSQYFRTVSFPMHMGVRHNDPKDLFQLWSIPMNIIIDEKGIVRERLIGTSSLSEAVKILTEEE